MMNKPKELKNRIQELEEKLNRKDRDFRIEMYLKNSTYIFITKKGLFTEYEKYFDKHHLRQFKKIENR